MGDRVLFQVVSRYQPEAFGPVVYCHWSGGRAPQIVKALAERMVERPNDISYATARLVQRSEEHTSELHHMSESRMPSSA